MKLIETLAQDAERIIGVGLPAPADLPALFVAFVHRAEAAVPELLSDAVTALVEPKTAPVPSESAGPVPSESAGVGRAARSSPEGSRASGEPAADAAVPSPASSIENADPAELQTHVEATATAPVVEEETPDAMRERIVMLNSENETLRAELRANS